MLTETFADDFAGVGNHNKCMGIHLPGISAKGYCLMPPGSSKNNVAFLMAVRTFCHFDCSTRLRVSLIYLTIGSGLLVITVKKIWIG